MSTFGNRTTALRKALGLTQKEFGLAGNLTQSNLSNAENDLTLPNLDFVINVKFSFPNINLNWWISGEGLMFDHKIEKSALPKSVKPEIRAFLEDLSNQVKNISMTNKLLEVTIKKKKKS
jgi:transcriptional regulator with XRE-family HTH domain